MESSQGVSAEPGPCIVVSGFATVEVEDAMRRWRRWRVAATDLSLATVLVGFTADGKPDPTFGQGSVIRVERDHSGRMVVQPDGKLLVPVTAGGQAGAVAIQRLLAN